MRRGAIRHARRGLSSAPPGGPRLPQWGSFGKSQPALQSLVDEISEMNEHQVRVGAFATQLGLGTAFGCIGGAAWAVAVVVVVCMFFRGVTFAFNCSTATATPTPAGCHAGCHTTQPFPE